MELTNSHSHTNNSDGDITILEACEEAIAHRINHLYLTDHHLPDKLTWMLDFEAYFAEIKKTKNKLNGNINLHAGIELDWAEGYEKWFETQAQKPLDFILGAVHFLTQEKIYAAELPINELEKFTREYFHQTRRLACSGLADSIAHLDLIKYNSSETEHYYEEEIEKTLEVIAESKTAIEINTSSKRKGLAEFHPSTWILERAFQLGIPITIGTDSHHQGQVAYRLEEAYELARKIGYKSVLRFENRKPIEITI